MCPLVTSRRNKNVSAITLFTSKYYYLPNSNTFAESEKAKNKRICLKVFKIAEVYGNMGCGVLKRGIQN